MDSEILVVIENSRPKNSGFNVQSQGPIITMTKLVLTFKDYLFLTQNTRFQIEKL